MKLKNMMRRCRAMIWKSSGDCGRRSAAGYAPVYVGSDRRRFEIPVRYFNFPVIAGLLDKAEEEFGGAQPAGGLWLPCEPVFFEWVIDLLGRDEPRYRGMRFEEFYRLFTGEFSAGEISAGEFSAPIRRSQSSPFPALR